MGDIRIDWRTNKTINASNPTTASGMDGLAVMLSFGLKRQVVYIQSKTDWTDTEAEYLTIQLHFSLFRVLSLGVRFETLSHGKICIYEGDRTTYSLKIGLYSFCTQLDYLFFNRIFLWTRISSLLRNVVCDQIDSSERWEWKVSNIEPQYDQSLKKKNRNNCGCTVHSSSNLSNKYKKELKDDSIFEIPGTFILRWTYHRLNQWTTGVDWKYQRYTQTNSILFPQTKIGLGSECIYTYRLIFSYTFNGQWFYKRKSQ